ncbi:MAG TPA: hypothetical protein ENI23_11400, partial [bacterium]|nr:hypothetical protein [bacterium]
MFFPTSNGLGKSSIIIGKFSDSVIKDEKWFSQDIAIVKTGVVVIQMGLTSKPDVECTLDGGINWLKISKGLESNSNFRADVIVIAG